MKESSNTRVFLGLAAFMTLVAAALATAVFLSIHRQRESSTPAPAPAKPQSAPGETQRADARAWR